MYSLADKILESMTIIVDTREQPTQKAIKRWNSFKYPYNRAKLDFGDYSAIFECNIGDRNYKLDLTKHCAIERKMSLDELSANFTFQRERFAAEFDRAKRAKAKLYLLIENSSIDNIIDGNYMSNFAKNAYIASIFAWIARYNCHVIFCKSSHTSRIIPEILKREAKEILMTS